MRDESTRTSHAAAQAAPPRLERIPCGCKVQTGQVAPPAEARPDRSGPHRKPSTQTENALVALGADGPLWVTRSVSVLP